MQCKICTKKAEFSRLDAYGKFSLWFKEPIIDLNAAKMKIEKEDEIKNGTIRLSVSKDGKGKNGEDKLFAIHCSGIDFLKGRPKNDTHHSIMKENLLITTKESFGNKIKEIVKEILETCDRCNAYFQ